MKYLRHLTGGDGLPSRTHNGVPTTFESQMLRREMEGDHEGDWREAIQQSAREDLSNMGSVDEYMDENQGVTRGVIPMLHCEIEYKRM